MPVLDRDGDAAVLREGGAAALEALEPPKKITGFIRSTLGSLGPQERLIVQVPHPCLL